EAPPTSTGLRAGSSGSQAASSLPEGLNLELSGHGPRLLTSIDPDASRPVPTGLSELDRVLSGGLVPGSVTLLGGEPGIGKSTLVLQAVAAGASKGLRSLIVAAEESAEQVRSRAGRLGKLSEECFVLSTSDLFAAITAADQVRPSLLVIDSIQTISDASVSSPTGSPNQVRACAQLLAQYAKASGTATILVGHVTKDGSLAGPRTLEHLVDTVLSFEGDRHHALRALVATKHRFGPTGELGLFEMGELGLSSLSDPSTLLLGDRKLDAPGSVALPVVEGRRPLVVEVQALLARSRGQSPRRVVQGVTTARVALLLAVLERCCKAPVGDCDVFVSTVGGIRVSEPAGDLAVALAIVSGLTGLAMPPDTAVFGEVGLAGEVRQVPRADRRLAEAARLGFKRAVVPLTCPEPPEKMTLVRVRSVRDAVERLQLLPVVKVGREGPEAPPEGAESGGPPPRFRHAAQG
ncbi:MAG: DNA repair protein RadA, partial [Acidimicrobiales bacterium]